ncbi:hypothetical protein BKA61DRAFT_570893 [Leptodontidium sp. MPI-SDFR-AT-0119]|nr:hypothetical protein BKA61DRAFT_570893 [Leptodontidium sp. MPI-SDFR-AT-0119]
MAENHINSMSQPTTQCSSCGARYAYTPTDSSHEQALAFANSYLGPALQLSAQNPASQGDFPQSRGYTTQGFDQHDISAVSPTDYPHGHVLAFENSHLDSTLQFPDFGGYDGFADFASQTPWNNLMTTNPQETTTSFNDLLVPTNTDMSSGQSLPAHTTGIVSAPLVALPIPRGLASPPPNVNTKSHTCDYAGCGKRFVRRGDLVRHRNRHGVPQYPCDVNGCNRHHDRAFFRLDKLRDHKRKRHGMNL